MIKIKEITDLKEAEKLWRSISPNKNIYDEWDFRYCFYKYNPIPLKFLAAYEGSDGTEEMVGLLPLAHTPEHGLEFIAEDPCEENRLFIKPGREDVIPLLYGAIKDKAQFYDISGDDEFTKKFTIEDYIYLLPLEGINSFADYLSQRLSPRRARYLSLDLKKIEDLNPDCSFKTGANINNDTLRKLFEFSMLNFGEDSYLGEELNQRAWLDLIKIPWDWNLLEIKINGQLAAVSLGVMHKGEYHYLISGMDRSYPGLGKYATRLHLEEAIRLKAEIFDLGLGDCGWKQFWHFDLKPQYEFVKFI